MLTEDILDNPNTMFSKYITDEALVEFLVTTLKQEGTTEKFQESEEIAETMVALFRWNKQMNEQFTFGALQPLLAAAYLHNLFLDGETIKMTNLTKIRDQYKKEMLEDGIAESWVELILQSVEGCFGPDTPIPACTPHGDHPIMIFALSRYIVTQLQKDRDTVHKKE